MHLHSWKEFTGTEYKRCTKCGKIKDKSFVTQVFSLIISPFKTVFRKIVCYEEMGTLAITILGIVLGVLLIGFIDYSIDYSADHDLVPYTEENISKLDGAPTAYRVFALNTCFTHLGIKNLEWSSESVSVTCNSGLKMGLREKNNLRDLNKEFYRVLVYKDWLGPDGRGL